MGFFGKNNQQVQQMTQRQLLENKVKAANNNLLIVTVFTAINILLVLTKSNSYFLFSAFMPYYLAVLGMGMCGMFPDEYYGGDTSGYMFLSESFLYVMLAIAAAIMVLYLLAWILTKKGKAGWLIFALVFFGLDTVLMVIIGGFNPGMIMDYVFHAWVVYSLFAGISAAKKLKNLPPEVPVAVFDADPVAAEQTVEE